MSSSASRRGLSIPLDAKITALQQHLFDGEHVFPLCYPVIPFQNGRGSNELFFVGIIVVTVRLSAEVYLIVRYNMTLD